MILPDFPTRVRAAHPGGISSPPASAGGLLVVLQGDMGLLLLFVTHSLALVRSVSQEVAVMNDDRIVEYGNGLRGGGAPANTSSA